MRRPQFYSWLGIFAVCVFCGGNVGGVGQSPVLGKQLDCSVSSASMRSKSSPAPCFVKSFSPAQSAAAEKSSLHSALVRQPRRALTLRQRSSQACRMVFLPPDWEEAPSRKGDSDLDIDPFEVGFALCPTEAKHIFVSFAGFGSFALPRKTKSGETV
jgi:hypothetical protein